MVAMKRYVIGFCVTAVALAGCKIVVAPTINLPAQQASIEQAAQGYTQDGGQWGSSTLARAIESRRYRTAEVQRLKDQRLVGENRRGYLEIIDRPAGEYGNYVQRIVEAENADRRTIYAEQAASLNLPLAKVEEASAHVIAERSFRGEWIQQQDGKWIQKKTDSSIVAGS
jgi:uncharacterized protein YdbL (DUF1318 family)